ncbi:hypothetical protein DY000_02049014 [Brassica cretica]|uniref:Ig-like domain-containing protein n=1 Tax=Brassica cretica TaxID=69181 RepID=A0ABQ7EXM0_BRACR|nr:hypothetical protein DY000_02049014 [Brassica cretica]
MGAEKYSRLIAGQKFTGRIEIAQMNREARGVSMHESRTWCPVSSKLSVNRSTTCHRHEAGTCSMTWEVMSKSRSVQSSPIKSSIGFWLSLLRSTSCLSPRTLSLLPQIGTTKPVVPPASPIEDRGTTIPIEDRDRVIPERLRLCGVIVKGLPVSLVWRKNDFVGPN